LQEAKEALSGDKARLEDLQRLLRTRQRCMVGQVAALYPVRVFHDLPQHAENPRADTNGENPLLIYASLDISLMIRINEFACSFKKNRLKK